jgi:hypothetical protein
MVEVPNVMLLCWAYIPDKRMDGRLSYFIGKNRQEDQPRQELHVESPVLLHSQADLGGHVVVQVKHGQTHQSFTMEINL